MGFDGEAAFAEEGEVAFGGVGGGALAGGGVGDGDDVAAGDVVGVQLLDFGDDGGGVLGVVLVEEVEFVAAADADLHEAAADVEVDADEDAVVGVDGLVGPVEVAVEVGVDSGGVEVGELTFEVGREELWGVVGVEGVDEAGGQVGVIEGAGADEVAVGAVAFFAEGFVHVAVALGGRGDGQLGVLTTAETG